jgi:hypothetical protein
MAPIISGLLTLGPAATAGQVTALRRVTTDGHRSTQIKTQAPNLCPSVSICGFSTPNIPGAQRRRSISSGTAAGRRTRACNHSDRTELKSQNGWRNGCCLDRLVRLSFVFCRRASQGHTSATNSEHLPQTRLRSFLYPFCAPPASTAAVGEAQRSPKHNGVSTAN